MCILTKYKMCLGIKRRYKLYVTLGFSYELSDELEIKVEINCVKLTKPDTFEVERYKVKGVLYGFNKSCQQ